MELLTQDIYHLSSIWHIIPSMDLVIPLQEPDGDILHPE